MKYLILLTLLAISMHAILCQDAPDEGGAQDPSGGDPPENPETPTDGTESGGEPDNAGEGDANTEGGGAENPPSGGNAEEPTNEGGDESAGGDQQGGETGGETDASAEAGDQSAQNPPQSGTGEATKEKTIKEKIMELMTKNAKCGLRFNTCYGSESKVPELKGKTIKNLTEDEYCEYLKKGEECLKTMENNEGCEDKDFEAIKEVACCANRGTVISLILIGILAFISKMLSQH